MIGFSNDSKVSRGALDLNYFLIHHKSRIFKEFCETEYTKDAKKLLNGLDIPNTTLKILV